MNVLGIVDLYKRLSPSLKSSLIIIFILIVFAIVIGIKAKKQDPNKAPKGVLLLVEILVKWVNGMCNEIMGEKGKRYSLPNSEIMIHQPLGGAQGQASDIKIQADHIMKTKKLTFIESLMLVAGAGIGTGILTIPYAIDKIGVLGTVTALALAYAVSAVMYLIIADLTRNSEKSEDLLAILDQVKSNLEQG